MQIPLEIQITRTPDKGRVCWIDPQTGRATLIENAVAGYFRKNGWIVPYGESLKAASYRHVLNAFMLSLMFENYDHKNPDNKEVFEDLLFGDLKLYPRPTVQLNGHTFGNSEPRIEEHRKRFSDAKERTQEQAHVNLKSSWRHFVQRHRLGKDYFGGNLTPAQMNPLILKIYRALGVDRFLKCMDLMSRTRRQGILLGWPDLALWNDDEFLFVEVKGPKDKLRSHQKICIEALNGMGIKAEIIQVKAA